MKKAADNTTAKKVCKDLNSEGAIFVMKTCFSTLERLLNLVNILSVNEKLPVSKFRYFGKYIIQLSG